MSKNNLPAAFLYLIMTSAVSAANEEKKNMTLTANYPEICASSGTQTRLWIVSHVNAENPYYRDLENKIKGFSDLTGIAKEIGVKVVSSFKDKGLKVQKTSSMLDGGVSFEFFTPSRYHLIEIYNDGDIVYLERRSGEDSVVEDIDLEGIKQKLYELKTYGE